MTMTDVTEDDAAAGGDEVLAVRGRRLRRRLERLIGVAATEGNELTALRNGDEIFTAMLSAIRAAEHTVDLMTFVYWKGEIARDFAAALCDRARAGCGCGCSSTVSAAG